jgi:uncharacterized SAM-dependent methyltransferase
MAKQKKASQINDLIFKELIKRGYALEGKTRVWNIADSKLWYLTPEQSQAYLDLEDSENFKELASNMEFDLLAKAIPEIISTLEDTKGLNIIDLGCGDGKKAFYFVEEIKDKYEITYCPIDISGYMVTQAMETFSSSKVEKKVDFRYNISDFENLENITSLLKYGRSKKNLFLLLGHTLGNFEINDLLYKIRSAMHAGDVLVIVSGIANSKWNEWIEKVKDEKRSKMNSFFIHIPLLLGLDRDNLEFNPRFKNSRVEYTYTIKKSQTINFQDKSITFDEGDQIMVAVSYKHKEGDLLTFFNLYFGQTIFKKSKDNSTFLAICKK